MQPAPTHEVAVAVADTNMKDQPEGQDLFSQLENKLENQLNNVEEEEGEIPLDPWLGYIPTVEEIMGDNDEGERASSQVPPHDPNEKQTDPYRVLQALQAMKEPRRELFPQVPPARPQPQPQRRPFDQPPTPGRRNPPRPILSQPHPIVHSPWRDGESLPCFPGTNPGEIIMPLFMNLALHVLPQREELEVALQVRVKLLKRDDEHDYQRISILPQDPRQAGQPWSKFFCNRAFVFFCAWVDAQVRAGEVIPVLPFMRGYIDRETEELAQRATALIAGQGLTERRSMRGPHRRRPMRTKKYNPDRHPAAKRVLTSKQPKVSVKREST